MGEMGSRVDRMLAVLDIFTAERYAWTVEEIADHLGYTLSSTYRYLRSLLASGLLTRLPGGRYVLGAKIIELDSLIQHSDPVTRAARGILEKLSHDTNCHALLASVHGAHVVNVLHLPGRDPLALTFIRGHRLPWFRGAPGKAILARMARADVRELFRTEMPELFADEPRWSELWAELRKIRKAGYCVSLGELDDSVVGFGAAIAPNDEPIGSISLACSADRGRMLSTEGLGQRLKAAAAEIEAALTRDAQVPAAR